jgi:cholesterol transport system auxiliary component
MTPLRLLPLLLALLPLAGCAALASLGSAAQPLDTYELSLPPAPAGPTGTAGPTLLVDVPTASAGLATDRIMIRPGRLRVAYLPDGRWVDAAPAHVQQLLIGALSRSGRLAFVGGGVDLSAPDYVLLTDLEAFQAEVSPAGAPTPVRVVVRMRLALVRDLDQRVVRARRFEQTAAAASDDAPSIVAAFDAAMRALLAEAAEWTLGGLGAGA